MEYGQFCPIAKATEIIGEKWTVLIIREALMGSTRYSEFQRGLSLISPTMLVKRLDSLVAHGLLMKKKIPAQKGSVIRFKFTDIEDLSEWWLVVTGDKVDVCVKDPGKDVDVYLTSTVKTMADIWMGDTTYRRAKTDGALRIVGHRELTRDVTAWMNLSVFANLPPASEI